MKILTIGDPHGRDDWKDILYYAKYIDKVVFIGDYFDSFDLDAQTQMENFKEIVAYKRKFPDKAVLLYGNHDLHYILHTECYSGFQDKYKWMIETLLLDAEDVMQWAYEADGYLFTHAGVTKTWCVRKNIDPNNLVESINAQPPESFAYAKDAVCSRGGDDIFQSPVWVRPYSLAEDMIPGYKQVVGHTEEDQIYMLEDGMITVVDAPKSMEYLKINDGEMKINKYKKLK